MSIGTWLSDLGLGVYRETFEDEGIDDFDILFEYSEEDLKALGIKGGHCKKILKALAALNDGGAHTAGPSESDGGVEGATSPSVPSSDLSGLIDQLPHVIAMPLHEYVEEGHPGMKLWAACDAVELLLRFLVTVGVADRQRHGKLDDRLLKQLWGKIEIWRSPTKSGGRRSDANNAISIATSGSSPCAASVT